MEVHHHAHPASGETHTSRKKWSHYFWEFFMLFLAVSLGFFVENQREHYVEHLREKQFMVSMVEDLNGDIAILDHQLRIETISLTQMDSLIFWLTGKSAFPPGRLYYLARMASRHDIFSYNNRTIEQMRNSGGFRLIRKEEISKQIMSYYRQIGFIEMLEAVEKNEEHEYRKAAVRVFDPFVFNSMVNNEDSIVMAPGNPALIASDRSHLIELAGWTQYMKSSVQGLTHEKEALRESAEKLISSIQKEYHLE